MVGHFQLSAEEYSIQAKEEPMVNKKTALKDENPNIPRISFDEKDYGKY